MAPYQKEVAMNRKRQDTIHVIIFFVVLFIFSICFCACQKTGEKQIETKPPEVATSVFTNSETLKNQINLVFDGLYDGDRGAYMAYLISNGFKLKLLTKQETLEYIKKLEAQSSVIGSWWVPQEIRELKKTLGKSPDFFIFILTVCFVKLFHLFQLLFRINTHSFNGVIDFNRINFLTLISSQLHHIS
jgi:hypothetical protein